MTPISEAWERFWFAPRATSTLAILRIGIGLLVFAWTLSLLPDLFTFYSPGGIVPKQPGGQGPAVWGLLGIFQSDVALVVVYVALLLGSAAVILGFWTRLAALVMFLGLLSFDRRTSYVLNSGDGLVRILALYLVLAPAGASLSLDRWRRARDRFWEFPARAPWVLRLFQIQLTVIYLSTVWQKVRGTTWNDGTAVSYALRLEDLERFPLPGVFSQSVTLANFQTLGTLAIEFSIGILVWNRVLRPWVLGLGVFLHLGIDYSMRVGFFSYAMLVAYLAFIPPETASALILRARDRLARSRLPAPLRPRAAIADASADAGVRAR